MFSACFLEARRKLFHPTCIWDLGAEDHHLSPLHEILIGLASALNRLAQVGKRVMLKTNTHTHTEFSAVTLVQTDTTPTPQRPRLQTSGWRQQRRAAKHTLKPWLRQQREFLKASETQIRPISRTFSRQSFTFEVPRLCCSHPRYIYPIRRADRQHDFAGSVFICRSKIVFTFRRLHERSRASPSVFKAKPRSLAQLLHNNARKKASQCLPSAKHLPEHSIRASLPVHSTWPAPIGEAASEVRTRCLTSTTNRTELGTSNREATYLNPWFGRKSAGQQQHSAVAPPDNSPDRNPKVITD